MIIATSASPYYLSWWLFTADYGDTVTQTGKLLLYMLPVNIYRGEFCDTGLYASTIKVKK